MRIKKKCKDMLLFVIILQQTIIFSSCTVLDRYTKEIYRTQEARAQICSNNLYTGIIDGTRVRILDKKGNRVSSINTEDIEFYADKILLGEEAYYLVQYEYDVDRPEKSLVLKVDYQTGKYKKAWFDELGDISYADGKLFIANWFDNYVTGNFSIGLYANSYLLESNFGQEPIRIDKNNTVECQIGKVKLYYHKDGYYCTEPDIGSYLGSFQKIMDLRENSEKNFDGITYQRERKNWLLVKGEAKKYDGISCQINEYQKEDKIYGVCNVIQKNILDGKPIPVNKICGAFSYEIDCKNDTIKILFQSEKAYVVMCTSNYVVYQENDEIITYEFATKHKERILLLQENSDEHIEIYKGIFRIIESLNDCDKETIYSWRDESIEELVSFKRNY